MFKGKIFEAQVLEYRCESHVDNYSASSPIYPYGIFHEAWLETSFTPDYLSTALGFYLKAGSSRWFQLGATQPTEDPTSTYRLKMDAIGTDATVTTAEFHTGVVSRLVFTDVVVRIRNDALWQIEIGTVEWWCNDSLEGSWSGVEAFSTMVPTPSSIPIMPGPVRVGGFCRISAGTETGLIYPRTDTSSCAGTAKVGFRFKQGGVWYMPKAKFVPAESVGGPSLVGMYSATTMWDGVLHTDYAQLTNYSYRGTMFGYDVYDRESSQTDRTIFSATLYPDYEKSVQRLNDDYGAMIYRGAFPACTARATYTRIGGDRSNVSRSQTTEPLPAQSEFLAVVGLEKHPIEDPLDKPSYSHVSLSAIESVSDAIYAVAIPAGTHVVSTSYDNPAWLGAYTHITRSWFDTSTWVFPHQIKVLTTPGNRVMSYLSHADPKVVYFNTWCNPHWSYCLWFPLEKNPDTGASRAGATAWKIEDVEVTPQEYWLTERAQYLRHPALPAGENKRIRNTILTEPLRQSGFAGLMLNQVFGQITSWWGISRFRLQKFQPAGNYPSTGETAAAWSFVDPATGTVSDGGITFDGDGNELVVAILDVGRWDMPPYMAPHGCDRIFVSWSDPNIASMTVKCVGSDGAEVVLATSPGTYLRPRAPGNKYAGTWGHDYSGNLASDELSIVDQGLDLLPEGDSADWMEDREKAFCFGLLPGSGCARLRFEVERVDPDATATFEHPVFLPPSSDNRRIVYESAPYASLLCAQGPVIRYGVWTYWDPLYGFVHEPPNLNTPELMPTALDWLCWHRQAIKGVPADDLLDEEIATVYEEGEEYTLRKHLALDADNQVLTHSFVCDLDRERLDGEHQFAGVMVSSYREVPPLAGFPTRLWDMQEGTQTLQHGQATYSLIATKRWLVNPGGENNLIPPDPPGAGDWLTQDNLVYKWFGGWHLHSLDGSEQREWKVRRGETDYAKVRPWRGYVWIADTVPEAGPVGGWHARTCYRSGLTYAVKVSAEGLDLWRYNRRGSVFRSRIFEDTDLVEAQLAVHPRGRVSIYYTKPSGGGYDVLRIDSVSHGRAWSEPVSAFPGKMVAPATDDRTGVEYAAAWDDGDWRLWRKKTRDSDWEDLGEIVTGAPENRAGLTVTAGPRRELAFHYFDGTDDRRLVTSDDGEHWQEA